MAKNESKKISDVLKNELRALGVSETTIENRKKQQIGNNGRPIEEEVTFTGDIKIEYAESATGAKYPYYVCVIEEKHKQSPSLKSLLGLSSVVGCLNKGETAVNQYYKKKSDSEPTEEILTATANIKSYEPFDGFITRNLDDLADYLQEHPEILKGKKGTYLGTTIKTHESKKDYEFSGTYVKSGLKRAIETKLWNIV